MHDRSDRYRVKTVPTLGGGKRLGSYLVDAGLLTSAQIEVALNDQKVTGMRFGEILAARGWVKQQTVDYLMEKIVLPERQASKKPVESASKPETRLQGSSSAVRASGGANTSGSQSTATSAARSENKLARRDLPISKPLPSVSSSDGDVNWVG